MIHGPKPAAIHNHYNNAPEINTYITKGDGAAIEHTAMFTYAGFRCELGTVLEYANPHPTARLHSLMVTWYCGAWHAGMGLAGWVM